MINLVVAGAGEGTYKNLAAAIRSQHPAIGMQLATVIDIKPREELHPAMQRLIAEEGIHYVNRLAIGLPSTLPENAVGVVMTPNASHLEYAEFFLTKGIHVWIEKPPVIRLEDIQRFSELAARYPHLIYAAEYATDGKALPLLWAGGTLAQEDKRFGHLTADCNIEYVGNVIARLGQPILITGKLLEGSGSAGNADHRAWLLDGTQGGMIRDLASHLFGPLYDMGLAGESVLDAQVKLGRYEPGSALGTFRPLRSADEGETYAEIMGIFPTPRGLIPFKFEVGKYWPQHDRRLDIHFDHGVMCFSYESPFTLSILWWTRNARSISVATDHYPSLALLDFKNFIESKPYAHGHIGRAIAIVRFNETMRARGLQKLGLVL